MYATGTCVVVLCLLGACGFRVPGSAAADGSIDVLDGTADAPGDVLDGPPFILCDPINPALRACFTFDGDTLDGSAAHNDAVGTNLPFVAGHHGQAAFTASSTLGIPVTGSSLDLARFTIKMWIRPTAIPVPGTRGGLVDSDAYRMFVQPSGLVRCAFNSSASLVEVFSATGIQPLVWTRVTCIYDGSNLVVYLNGAQSNSIATTAGVKSLTTDVTIGQNEPSLENFNGAIDDLEIWNAIVAP